MAIDSTSISLLHRLRDAGSDSDWIRFAKLYSPLLFHWGRSQGLDATDAADLVQDVMAKLVVKLRDFQYDPKLKFRSWLRTVAVNRARDLQRAASARKATGTWDLNAEAEQRQSTADLLEHSEYCSYLVTRGRDLIQSEFEPLTWEACWKYAAEERPAADVARELGITSNAVRIAKCRVFARLRKELEGLLD